MGKFLAGFGAGVALTLLLCFALMLIFSPSVVSSIALDDLATYRQCVEEAKVDEAAKVQALARIDRIIERVQGKGIGFWEYAMATSDLDPMTADKVLTPDEWPQFEAELRSAEVILVGAPKSGTSAPTPGAVPAAEPAKN